MLKPVDDRVFNYIRTYITRHGQAPTTREATMALGYASSGGLIKRVQKLQRHGVLSWEPGKPRSFKILIGPVSYATETRPEPMPLSEAPEPAPPPPPRPEPSVPSKALENYAIELTYRSDRMPEPVGEALRQVGREIMCMVRKAKAT